MAGTIKIAVLCRNLDISRSTVNKWGLGSPAEIKRLPISLPYPDAIIACHQRWLSIRHMVELTGIKISTIRRWCKTRQGFAIKVGRDYRIPYPGTTTATNTTATNTTATNTTATNQSKLIRSMLESARARARTANLPFTLTYKDVAALPWVDQVTGAPLSHPCLMGNSKENVILTSKYVVTLLTRLTEEEKSRLGKWLLQ